MADTSPIAEAFESQRERLRAELAELLMSERADLTAVRTTAAAAGWPLPTTAALVVVAPGHAHEFLSRLDSRALPVRRPELTGAIVTDPDGPGRRTRPVVHIAIDDVLIDGVGLDTDTRAESHQRHQSVARARVC